MGMGREETVRERERAEKIFSLVVVPIGHDCYSVESKLSNSMFTYELTNTIYECDEVTVILYYIFPLISYETCVRGY